MCEWTDKYPEGSEHWLFGGGVTDTDPGDGQPLCFVKGDEWIDDYLLEKVEDKGHVLEKLIDSLGFEVVLKALEKRIGVPKSVHWKTLKVGDAVEVVDKPHRDDVDYFGAKTGPFVVVEIEDHGYTGALPFAVRDKADEADTTTQWWPHLSSIKGVHGDS